jgi:hypothetical protein
MQSAKTSLHIEFCIPALLVMQITRTHPKQAILIIRDLLGGRLRFACQFFKGGNSVRVLGAWNENYGLATGQPRRLRSEKRHAA